MAVREQWGERANMRRSNRGNTNHRRGEKFLRDAKPFLVLCQCLAAPCPRLTPTRRKNTLPLGKGGTILKSSQVHFEVTSWTSLLCCFIMSALASAFRRPSHPASPDKTQQQTSRSRRMPSLFNTIRLSIYGEGLTSVVRGSLSANTLGVSLS